MFSYQLDTVSFLLIKNIPCIITSPSPADRLWKHRPGSLRARRLSSASVYLSAWRKRRSSITISADGLSCCGNRSSHVMSSVVEVRKWEGKLFTNKNLDSVVSFAEPPFTGFTASCEHK